MRRILIISFLMAVAWRVNSQYSIGVGYAGTHPLADFQTNNYKDGNGIDFYFLSKAYPEYSRVQVQIGGDFNVFNTGARNISNMQTSSGYNAKYALNNYHHALSFKTRFLTQENTLRYHADIDLGYRSFYTTEGLTFDQTATNQPENTSNFLKHSNAFFTGITAGLLYRVNDWLSLDIYSRIDFGASATWLDLNSFSIKNNLPDYANFQYKSTNTSLLWAGISAIIHFNGQKFNQIERSPNQAPQQETVPTYPTPEPPSTPSPRGRVAR